MKEIKGITFIELLFFAAAIGIVVFLARPSVVSMWIASNERKAIVLMKTIHEEQLVFSTAYHLDEDSDGTGDFGTIEMLSNSYPSVEVVTTSLTRLADGSASGYIFAIEVDTAGIEDESYVCIASPVSYGTTGVRSFHMDQSGDITATSHDQIPTMWDTPVD
ncbi:hypothetical protein ACFL1X_14130 [Candidatus Hydrogenedentota bacterium]